MSSHIMVKDEEIAKKYAMIRIVMYNIYRYYEVMEDKKIKAKKGEVIYIRVIKIIQYRCNTGTEIM